MNKTSINNVNRKFKSFIVVFIEKKKLYKKKFGNLDVNFSTCFNNLLND